MVIPPKVVARMMLLLFIALLFLFPQAAVAQEDDEEEDETEEPSGHLLELNPILDGDLQVEEEDAGPEDADEQEVYEEDLYVEPEPTPVQTLVCPVCGNEYSTSVVFCPLDGAKLVSPGERGIRREAGPIPPTPSDEETLDTEIRFGSPIEEDNEKFISELELETKPKVGLGVGLVVGEIADTDLIYEETPFIAAPEFIFSIRDHSKKYYFRLGVAAVRSSWERSVRLSFGFEYPLLFDKLAPVQPLLGHGFGFHFGKSISCSSWKIQGCDTELQTMSPEERGIIHLSLFGRVGILIRPIQRLSITVEAKPDYRFGGLFEEERWTRTFSAFTFGLDVATIIYF